MVSDLMPTSTMSARVDAGELTVIGGGDHVGIPGPCRSPMPVSRQRHEASIAPCWRLRGPPAVRRARRRGAAGEGAEGGTVDFTSAPAGISTGGPVIITIGTPIDEFLNPVRRWCRIASMRCCRISPTASS
jgi:UDP-N-acetyl-D-mannosaminuronic acid dehydrogenase